MIKTEEYSIALERRKTILAGLISTADYLPFTLEFVPIITKTGEVMRGHIQLGDGISEPREFHWVCQPMNHGPGQRTLQLKDVAFWIG